MPIIFAILIAVAITLNLIGFFAFKKIKFKVAKILIIIVYVIIYGVPTLWLIWKTFSSDDFDIDLLLRMIIVVGGFYLILFLSTTIIISLLYLVGFLKKFVGAKLNK